MAKQTLKARRSLKKGSLRRKTPAPKAEKPKRVRLQLGDGNSMLVSAEYAEAWQAGYARGARRGQVVAVWPPSRASQPEAQARPNLLSRIKAWWRR